MHYGHGDDSYRYSRTMVANHSTNIWPLGPSKALKEHLCQEISSIGSYPECFSESLIEKLSQKHQLASEHIGAFNGIAEAIYLIAQHYREKRSAIVYPAFSEYEDATIQFGHHNSYISEKEFSSTDLGNYDLCWICNPNNPTGKIYTKAELIEKVKAFPQTLFIIDEAYMELIAEDQSLVSECSNHHNLIVMQSLTKNFAIPGLRLGVVYSSPETIASLHSIRPPWSVNSMALTAGNYLLDHPPYDQILLEQYLENSRKLQTALSNIANIEVEESETGFFLFRTPIKSEELKEKLVNEYGILVRDASNFRGLSPYHIRIAALGEEKDRHIVEALKNIFES